MSEQRAYVEVHADTEVYAVWLVAGPRYVCECGECDLPASVDVMITLLRDGEEWRLVVRVAGRHGDEVRKSGTVAMGGARTRDEMLTLAESTVATVVAGIEHASVDRVIIDAKGPEATRRFLRWRNTHPVETARGGTA